MFIRKSTQEDLEAISNLLKICFGDRTKYGATDNLEDRYVLAFENEQLIAMTGLVERSPSYYGSEIDWTCVLPEYRGKGLMTSILSFVIKETDRDIYCSCLRLHDNDRVNLQHCMDRLGFDCVAKAHKRFCSDYMRACDDCVFKQPKTCHCCEDLYVKRQRIFLKK